jgi:hypothetical protein
MSIDAWGFAFSRSLSRACCSHLRMPRGHLLFEHVPKGFEFGELQASASPRQVSEFGRFQQEPALGLQACDRRQQTEPTSLQEFRSGFAG